ncbi:MAG TPA: hypothetical protein VHR35_13350 [Nocardioides sp.]|jgi:hypothetical protein|nr:hypothetical protein [Nocardioides sp.]
MPVLSAPLSVADGRTLRQAVLDLATTDRRRRIPPALHLGVPGGPTLTIPDDRAWDHAQRSEIAGAALRATGDAPWAWVTRSGPLAVQDVDAAWLRAVVAAAAEREVDVAFVVVTRHGWLDPRSGLRREWLRIRHR